MSINVLIIGNGGREHALAWKLSQSVKVGTIFVAPGNGGTSTISKAVNVPISSSKANFPELVKFAVDNKVGLVVPGPEQPLVEGISDLFNKVGIPVFGPSAKAAQMEGSKTFSKDFMKKHGIPTADFQNFTQFEDAKKYIESTSSRLVIKASGMAGGKGVLIPETKEEALKAIREIMVERSFGEAGDEVVIEEYLEGDELSILCLTDGYSMIDLPAAQDHKRIGDGDSGLNTGGMGAYAPAPIATPQLLAKIRKTILEPSITGMRRDGFPMVGCLFVGIMVTPSGEPKTLEYNVRFGDPETQTVLPLVKTDLFEIMIAAAEHRLDSVDVEISNNFSTTVVMSAGGYPEAYPKGDAITFTDLSNKETVLFHAGTSEKGGDIVTSGGRVIAATAFDSDLATSIKKAYEGVKCVSYQGKYHRGDIAHRAFRDSAKLAEHPHKITYADAGVSVDNGNQLVDSIKKMVRSTARPGAEAEIGGFGGVFDLVPAGYNDIANTLIVAATDGVGTKLRIAQIMDIHNTVGVDLVAMNVNDLVVQGAEPLMFLDYFATGKLDVQMAADFVQGVTDGCKLAACALVGGETSEMPGMYELGHYDSNGTAVGAVLKGEMLPKLDIMAAGDVIIGIKSDGLHSNGYSLVRKIIESSHMEYTDKAPWDESTTIGEAVLVPTRIYVQQILPCVKQHLIHGLAHITGGGLVENIPRALPSHLCAKVDMSTWTVPEIFKWFGKTGGVPTADILKTFNMGIGMVAIVQKENVETLIKQLESAGETVYTIGELVEREAGMPGCVVENYEGLY